jgi:hypothetical protein
MISLPSEKEHIGDAFLHQKSGSRPSEGPIHEAVLALADRSDRALAVSLDRRRLHLVEAVAAIDQLRPPDP